MGHYEWSGFFLFAFCYLLLIVSGDLIYGDEMRFVWCWKWGKMQRRLVDYDMMGFNCSATTYGMGNGLGIVTFPVTWVTFVPNYFMAHEMRSVSVLQVFII